MALNSRLSGLTAQNKHNLRSTAAAACSQQSLGAGEAAWFCLQSPRVTVPRRDAALQTPLLSDAAASVADPNLSYLQVKCSWKCAFTSCSRPAALRSPARYHLLLFKDNKIITAVRTVLCEGKSRGVSSSRVLFSHCPALQRPIPGKASRPSQMPNGAYQCIYFSLVPSRKHAILSLGLQAFLWEHRLNFCFNL